MENKNQDQFDFSKTEQYAYKVLNKLPFAFEPQKIMIVYVCLAILDFLDVLDKYFTIEQKQDYINWIYSLQIFDEDIKDGGFKGSMFLGLENHESEEKIQDSCNNSIFKPFEKGHIVYTYSALCSLKILGDTNFTKLRKQNIIKHIQNLQQPNGNIKSVEFGIEQDMRQIYASVAISYFINDFSGLNQTNLVNYILSCQNFNDGGFSITQGQESHGGATYCALASLKLLNKIHLIPNKTKLINWLTQRQNMSDDDQNKVGVNGRTNKLHDSCYTFWVGESLNILGYSHFLNSQLISQFLKDCQCQKSGAFCKYPFSYPDPIHTLHSLYGLQIIGILNKDKNKDQIVNCTLGIKQIRI